MKNNLYLALCFIVVISLLFYFNHDGIGLSDQYLYIKSAYSIAHSNFHISKSVFSNRFLVFGPLILVIQVFGVNSYALALWSLVCFVILLISTYFFLKKYNTNWANSAVILLLFSPLLLKHAADILPDIVMLVFSTLAFYSIVKLKTDEVRRPTLLAFCFISSIFGAFLAKETVIYLAPFYFVWFCYDVFKKRNFPFWIASVLFTILIFGSYFFIYYISTGEAFYRFTAIENEHNASTVWSYHGSSLSTILARLTFEPILFLISHYHIGFLILPMVIFLKPAKKLINERLLFYVILYFIYLILMHWLATTSFKDINPLPLLPRMWILIVPPAAIITGRLIIDPIPINKEKMQIIYIKLIACAIITLVSTFYFHNNKYLFTLAFIAILFFIQYFRGKTSIRTILYVLPLVFLQFSLIIKKLQNRPMDFTFEKRIIYNLDKQNNAVLISDPQLIRRIDIYLGFHNPHFETLAFTENGFKYTPDKNYYVLCNKERMTDLKNRYNKEIQPSISSILKNLRPIQSNGEVKLYQIK